MAEDKHGKTHKKTSGNRKAAAAKAGHRKLTRPGANGGPVTSPEARKRGRWLAGLYATRQPQYPRLEAVKNDRGEWETKELPPQERATRAQFHGSNHYGHAEPFVMTRDVPDVPALTEARREWLANWRMRPPVE